MPASNARGGLAARLLLVSALAGILVSAFGPGAAGAARAAAPAVAQDLPAVSAAWPFERFELGVTDSPGGAARLAGRAPYGMRYQYLAGGVNTGNGWRTWNTGGLFVDYYIDESKAAGIVPVFTYYMLLQSNPNTGEGELEQDLAHLVNTGTMTAYWADVTAFFQHARGDSPVVLHVEPDLWGYVMYDATSDNATTIPAAVASTGNTDLAGLPNNAAGFAQAFVRLRDRYAPNVVLAYHVSGWGTKVDLHLNAPSNAEVDALALRQANFYASLGADFDIAFTDIADRDAGWREFYEWGGHDGGASWWTSVDFPRWARFIRGFSVAAGKRVAVWQIPLGNTGMRAMNNTPGHYQDNRVEWFLDDLGDGHLAAWRDAGVVALLYGGGSGDTTSASDAKGDGMTNPAAINGNARVSLSADDDGGYFNERVAAYYAAGGLALAPGAPPPTGTPTPTVPAPTPAPRLTWTVSGVLSRTTVHRGTSVLITVRVRSSLATRALVDLEIYNARGVKVAQKAWDGRSFSAQVTRAFAYRWPIPVTRPLGKYTVKVGIFRPAWNGLLLWKNALRTFTVVR